MWVRVSWSLASSTVAAFRFSPAMYSFAFTAQLPASLLAALLSFSWCAFFWNAVLWKAIRWSTLSWKLLPWRTVPWKAEPWRAVPLRVVPWRAVSWRAAPGKTVLWMSVFGAVIWATGTTLTAAHASGANATEANVAETNTADTKENSVRHGEQWQANDHSQADGYSYDSSIARFQIPHIRVASWNLQWLSSLPPAELRKIYPDLPRRTLPTRHAADFRVLAAWAEKLNTDVLAFQEVADSKALDKLLGEGRFHYVFSDRQAISGASNRHRPWPQFVGFALRKGLDFQRHPDLTALDLHGRHSLRYGVDISLMEGGKPVLRLLAVHLKSGCSFSQKKTPNKQGKPQKKADRKACHQLFRQQQILEQWAEERAREPVPFIILGDFNRRLSAENDRFWQQLNDGQPAELALNRAGYPSHSQCPSRFYDRNKKRWVTRTFPHFIDHIVLDRRAALLMQTDSFREVVPEAHWLPDYQLSDHCPVQITIRLNALNRP